MGWALRIEEEFSGSEYTASAHTDALTSKLTSVSPSFILPRQKFIIIAKFYKTLKMADAPEAKRMPTHRLSR